MTKREKGCFSLGFFIGAVVGAVGAFAFAIADMVARVELW